MHTWIDAHKQATGKLPPIPDFMLPLVVTPNVSPGDLVSQDMTLRPMGVQMATRLTPNQWRQLLEFLVWLGQDPEEYIAYQIRLAQGMGSAVVQLDQIDWLRQEQPVVVRGLRAFEDTLQQKLELIGWFRQEQPPAPTVAQEPMAGETWQAQPRVSYESTGQEAEAGQRIPEPKRVKADIRVPTHQIPTFKKWYAVWQKIRPQWDTGTKRYKDLSDWLRKMHPGLYVSPETLADIIRAGEKGLLERLPERRT